MSVDKVNKEKLIVELIFSIEKKGRKKSKLKEKPENAYFLLRYKWNMAEKKTASLRAKYL
jgi:hypothetical protein